VHRQGHGWAGRRAHTIHQRKKRRKVKIVGKVIYYEIWLSCKAKVWIDSCPVMYKLHAEWPGTNKTGMQHYKKMNTIILSGSQIMSTLPYDLYKKKWSDWWS
jgi:hypothetical protein